MKNSVRYIILGLVVIIVIAAVYVLQQKPQTNPDADLETSVKFTGTVLAESSSPVIDFNKTDYETALSAGRLIVLFFYADWCPICKEEIPKFYEALQEIDDETVVGFRVNYNDDFTDSFEEDLAREFGVSYQHTKIFLVSGERVLKAPDSWDKERYITEINKLLN